MDTQNTEGKADETRSGPATGYATAVDAALAMSARTKDIMQHEKQYMRNDFECSMHTLAAEVRRLQSINEKLRDALGCGCGAYGMCKTCSALWAESHNEVAHPRREVEGGAK